MTKYLITVGELFNSSAHQLFRCSLAPVHCLHCLLPPQRQTDYSCRRCRPGGHNVLPQCSYKPFKISYINWACL